MHSASAVPRTTPTSWNVPGILLGWSWDVPRMFLGCSWDIPAIVLGCSWDFPGKPHERSCNATAH